MDRLVVFLATSAGVGYMPSAPGTFGSLLALPLLVALGRLELPPGILAAVIVGAGILAMPICGRACRIFGQSDSPRIVLDEICGMLFAGAFLAPTGRVLALTFLAFRFFDIVKPFPIGYFDRHVKNGVGVVADDLVAGIYANLVVRMLT